ncbi:DNA topoisomerase 3 [Escherichia coli]|uniref:DNA topoisomerase III n=1 Tax=unclassified Shigella TaxID=2629414 RepID=UPI0008482F2D|nr:MULTISPECIES: DNA topoisomerase 3 [unclassified Shigella]EKG0025563.1 DNA topoisomerase 3 [Vibrio cholerae]MDZ3971878.1 DNA topoisomerase 3 [Escherichia coli]CAJ0563603.1 DNA topoisomerase III [Proteus mirabilis]ODQ02203.1 DNA topoisomerase III [Shigella sp. FC130]OEJ08007.1 DNA topoisomerase III [Shigella sp. FC1967]
MDLYICEKPSQAKDLAGVMKASQRGDGFLHDGGNRVITWAFGHLLELYMPDDYDERYKSWSLETLPIAPESWRYNVRKSAFKQYKIVEGLVKKASTIYISTDYDREGEAIARSLLDRFRYSGPIRRVCLTALDESSIKKALNNVKDGKDTVSLYYAALARQRADWLVGMNVSRLYTVLARDVGFNHTLHVGRVITPTVALVCQRDREIAGFTPSPYWTLGVNVSVQNGQFAAQWIPPEECSDEQGRCVNKAYAEQVASQVNGANAVISKAETKPGKESAPLPFDLTSLQQYASKRWGYTAQQVLDAAQALYETHKATTYPRTDSRYLPESQKEDIPDILQALILSDQNVSGLVAGADPHRKTRVFNDAKVTAHHAIIPTPARTDISAMSEIEFNLYDAIRRFYIAQFYSEFEFTKTSIEVQCGRHLFAASGKTPTKQGWKVLFASDSESSPKDEGEDTDAPVEQEKLPRVSQGEPALLNGAELANKMTRPAPHFTEATLLAAMENIARFVTEEKFKQILKDTAGLGTPATRASIIQGAVDKGYFKRQKKVLLATDKAHALIAVLPPAIKSPGMTAAWEQELEKVASGSGNMSVFMKQISTWICQMVEQLKVAAPVLTKEGGAMAKAFEGAKPPSHECFNCGGEMHRIKGKNGFFWGCQNEACKKTFPDNRGKPEKRIAAEDCPDCPDCGSPMRLRKGKAPGKKRASKFWGCTAYPDCKGTMPFKKSDFMD